MDRNEIVSIFNKVFHGAKNFMTPNIIGFGKRGKMVYEISWGYGIRNDKIYGLTVIELPNITRHDLSTCFQNLKDLEAYISNDFQEDPANAHDNDPS